MLTCVHCTGGCGTFYQIIIASDEFKGLSLVKQQRLVNQTLKEEIQGIHGLQVRCFIKASRSRMLILSS